jgi:hypothetical protein
MGVTAKFQDNMFSIHVTDHARTRMIERKITDHLLVTIIETGQSKPKPQQVNAFWVIAEVAGRTDNLVCVSMVI